MAAVVGIGAIATIMREPEGAPSPPVDPNLFNINVRLFAKRRDGMLAIDPQPQSAVVGIDRGQLSALEGLVVVILGVGQQHLSREHRQAHWQRVVEALQALNVETDAETLSALPFDFVADGELRALLEE